MHRTAAGPANASIGERPAQPPAAGALGRWGVGGPGGDYLEACGVRVVTLLGRGEAAVDDQVVRVKRFDEPRHLARPGGGDRREGVERVALSGSRIQTALGAANGRRKGAARRGEELVAQLPAEDRWVLAVWHA
jgi:hypothetical protein